MKSEREEVRKEAVNAAIAQAKEDARQFNQRHIGQPLSVPSVQIDDFSFRIGFDAGAEYGKAAANHEASDVLTVASETNLFPDQYGDGTILTGVTPNDIWQLGYAACLIHLRAALTGGE